MKLHVYEVPLKFKLPFWLLNILTHRNESLTQKNRFYGT